MKTKLYTKLYRKVDGNNFLFSNEKELCFSTENSVSLSPHGEFCLVLEKKDYTGRYTDGDIDAGKNFGYDEMRVEMTMEGLLENLECIVVPDWWFDSEDKEYEEGQDPFDWIENLEKYCWKVIPERDYNTKIDFNF
ncbi:MAG: hypothetical protein GF317_23315 [Candidatus Lokiarchaeota archaeon]|nr:hypothetical protein [Candidatus Lokiarchaeota archaeon]